MIEDIWNLYSNCEENAESKIFAKVSFSHGPGRYLRRAIKHHTQDTEYFGKQENEIPDQGD